MKLCQTEWVYMSQNESDQQSDQSSADFENDLISKVDEYVPTDSIIELKSGIYNLVVTLVNSLMIEYGAVEAVKHTVGYLDSISNMFRKTLPENQNEEQKND